MRAGRGSWLRPRRALWVTALWVTAVPSASQEREGDAARPAFDLKPRDATTVELTFRIPEGWALYAPDLPARPAAEAGLPLEIRAGGTRVAPVSWPRPVSRSTVLGRSWVHDAGLHRAVLPRSPERAGPLEFRWALCRSDLCIPGRSVVPLPEGDGEGEADGEVPVQVEGAPRLRTRPSRSPRSS